MALAKIVGIGCHPPDAIGHESAQGAVAQIPAGEVVQPRALTLLVMQLLEPGHDSSPSWWPGNTSCSEVCQAGWSPAVSTLNP